MEEKVKAIIAEQLGLQLEEIKIDSRFVEDLGADSLDLVDLVMKLEDEFEVSIDDEQASNLRTVKDALDFIEKLSRAV
jgi:acyl carrier protein